ncbi:MAG: hypothetical protein U9Q27_03665 [Patescibacteria group bacterium]|nr:hypothetical protein [Patescibacteria group bacterium]
MENQKKYTKDEIWELYAKLPEELKDAFFSEKTGDDIYNICERNSVENKKIPEIAKNIGYVIVGALPLDELQNVLEKEIKLNAETAKKVFYQAYRFIFFPIKKQLEELYKIDIKVKLKKQDIVSERKQSIDQYREDIE